MNDKVSRFHVPSGMSPVTADLIAILKLGKRNDILTDRQLEQACGRDCSSRGNGYGNLQTACRYTLRHYGIVWLRVRGGGSIRCGNADDILHCERVDRRSMHRRSKRAVERLASVDMADLPQARRASYNAAVAVHGTIAMFTRTQSVKELEAKQVASPLNLGRLLESMKNGNDNT